jgi:hypothetical protein
MGLNDLKAYIIGIVCAMLLVTSGMIIISKYISVDSSLVTPKIAGLNKSLDMSANLSNSVNDMSGSLSSASTNNGALGWLDVLIGSAWTGLKTLGSSFSFMSQLFVYAGYILGIPTIIVTLASIIVTIIIVFAIWMSMMRLYQ